MFVAWSVVFSCAPADRHLFTHHPSSHHPFSHTTPFHTPSLFTHHPPSHHPSSHQNAGYTSRTHQSKDTSPHRNIRRSKSRYMVLWCDIVFCIDGTFPTCFSRSTRTQGNTAMASCTKGVVSGWVCFWVGCLRWCVLGWCVLGWCVLGFLRIWREKGGVVYVQRGGCMTISLSPSPSPSPSLSLSHTHTRTHNHSLCLPLSLSFTHTPNTHTHPTQTHTHSVCWRQVTLKNVDWPSVHQSV